MYDEHYEMLFLKITYKSYVLDLVISVLFPKIGDFRGEKCRGSRIRTYPIFAPLINLMKVPNILLMERDVIMSKKVPKCKDNSTNQLSNIKVSFPFVNA